MNLLPKVKTSKGIEEDYDPNKIIQTLIKETGLDYESSLRIAEDVSRKLISRNVTFLTSPLIREMVNSLLIEYGFEEERKKHTRLGVPLYDFSKKYKTVNESKESNEIFSSIESFLNKENCKDKIYKQIKREYKSLINFNKNEVSK